MINFMSEYEHQEPIFRSSPGEKPDPKIQKYLEDQKKYLDDQNRLDEIPTERDLTETQDMKDLRLVNEIMTDELMRGIFGYLVRNKYSTNTLLSSDDIKTFRILYSKESEFDEKAYELINGKLTTSDQTYKEYEQATVRLKNLLYPKE